MLVECADYTAKRECRFKGKSLAYIFEVSATKTTSSPEIILVNCTNSNKECCCQDLKPQD